jgi:predicted XRE-type DNA-binding protein
MEIWKDIKGFEGIYQVSNQGKVKSLERKTFNNGTKTVNKIKEKILKKPLDKNGYVRYCFFKDNQRFSLIEHRLVAIAFIPNPGNKPQINHKDGVKTNNSVNNLEWVTPRENTIHAILNGLSFQVGGEKHHMSKLTLKQVKEIFEIYKTEKITQKKLADIYNVSQSQINRILNKKRWKDYEFSK